MLSFDFESKLNALRSLQNEHQTSINTLQSCRTEEYISSANSLARKIHFSILRPIEKSIDICEIIISNGMDTFPEMLLNKWAIEVESAILNGGFLYD